MTTVVRRLKSAALVDPVNDPSDRAIMPMSTLLATDEWLLECGWDGFSIGDVQVFRNENAKNGFRAKGPDGKPLPDVWVWWGGVPHGKIKSYRFMDDADIQPQTMEPMPLELNLHAERKEEPRQAGKQGARA
jgi:hypothetical protein